MQIEMRTLGRTGLKVTVLGLGAGGNSRLGLSLGLSRTHAADVVRQVLDMGVNFIDTARAYQTEPPVGQALKGRLRDQIVVSSKTPYLDDQGNLLTPQAFAANIDASLRELGVETIDIYFFHGLQTEYYMAARDQFLPVLQQAKRQGKIRFLGVTEGFESDTRHTMLSQAVADPWEVLMVGFNFLNPSARERVFVHTRQTGAATLGMFAVRRALIDETWLRTLLQRMAEQGAVDPALATEPNLMQALSLRGVCETLSEAAYRFCAFEPGLDCVLSGTSNPAHLHANLEAVARGPLPEATRSRLVQLFGSVDGFSGQVR
jgi:aryl-alcohol dehydrogenase-like predicted oxidoreductase